MEKITEISIKNPKLLAICGCSSCTEMQNITWLFNGKYNYYASHDVEYPAKSFH